MTLQNFVDRLWINPKKVDRLQSRYEASSVLVVQPVPLAASPCNLGGGMGVQTGKVEGPNQQMVDETEASAGHPDSKRHRHEHDEGRARGLSKRASCGPKRTPRTASS